MTIEEKVRAVLVATSGVTTLVPAYNIKTEGRYQNLRPPYIILAPTTAVSTHSHEGLEDLTEWPFFQVWCVAADSEAVKLIAMAVRAALGDYKSADFRSMWRSEGPYLPDNERGIVELPVEFDIWSGLDT